MTPQVLADHLGGEQVLGCDIQSDFDLDNAVRHGLPVEAAESVLRAGDLRASELYALVIPRRTLAHRKRLGRRLTAEQSDRLARVIRIVVRADEAIGNPDKASRWLRKPNRALRGRLPLDLLDNDIGVRMVEQVLGRIEHGLGA